MWMTLFEAVLGLALAAAISLAPPSDAAFALARSTQDEPTAYPNGPVPGPASSAGFVENRGQWSTTARFVGRWGPTFARIEPAAIVLQMHDAHDRRRGVVVRIEFDGARADSPPRGEHRRPGAFNYLLGNDPERWCIGVPSYDRVVYRDLYDGVDLRLRSEHAHLKYDLLLDPGTRLDLVRFRCEGVEELSIDSDGSLVLETALGPIRQPVPITWQVQPSGERRSVECRYRLLDDGLFGFEAPTWDVRLPLVIDPGLVWSTYVGASLNDRATEVAVGPGGNVTVAGHTNSVGFPTTPGAFGTVHSGGLPPFYAPDVFITQLHADGSTAVFSTFLGGASSDRPKGLHVAGDGTITVAGNSGSDDFPVTGGAYDMTQAFGGKMFIARLDPTGSALVFSTLLGAGDATAEGLTAMHVDDAGIVTVTGGVTSPGFPTTPGAFKPTFAGAGDWDAFISRLSADGSSLLYSTFFGGSSFETAFAVHADSLGVVTFAGATSSADFPLTPGAFDTAGSSRFVARLDTVASRLVFSTYFGGQAGTGAEEIIDLHVDESGATTVAGYTMRPGFPVTAGAYDTNGAGSTDGFVSRLDPTGSTLLFSTLLGLGGSDYLRALHVDSAGVSTVFGATTSAAFPTTPGAYQTTKAGPIGGPGTDGFISRLSADGSTLLYSTFLGGSDDDADDVQAGERLGLAVGPFGDAYVAASTDSTDFPTTPGAWQETDSPFHDGFVACLDMLPAGVAKYGTSTPACAGPIAIGVTKMPRAGEPSFGLTSTNGPASAPGILLVGVGQDAGGTDVLGASVHLTPAAPFAAYVASSNTLGHATSTHAIPPGATGAQVFAQFLWLDPSGCGPLLSASNALALTVQP